MATIGAQLSILIKDVNGDSTTQNVYFTISDAITVAQLNTAIDTYLGTLDTVIDGIIQQVTTKTFPVLSGLKDTYGPSLIAEGALFTYLADVTEADRSFGQNTPTWARAKTVNGQVDTSDSVVQTYYRYWTTGTISNISHFLSNNWVSLLSPERVKLNTRKHRREQQRLNEEPVAP